MLRAIVRLGLVLLVMNQLSTPCAALRSKSYGKYDSGYNNPSNPKTLAGTSSGLPAQNTTRRGLGMALYYFSVCYPMCQGYSPSNRYDKMPKMALPTMA
ncbi:putative dipeptidyl peptidase IV [Operophtera brumata]|uniref:Putative dipeptidyl peptidase IV n=1 Tax=Operophtera brumata TaxID=104452 RepID=A0A0L7KZE4_OPEBR|nr:putative dipeptidyl peptidase IV [Operophtera brumata]